MILNNIFNRVNALKKHPYYYLSPHAFAVGNCAEEIYLGLIKAKMEGKKLIILFLFDIQPIFRYKLTNRSLFFLESRYIYNPNKYILFIIRLMLTLAYLPSRTTALIMRRFFNVRLDEAYSYPTIGRDELFMPDKTSKKFSFDDVKLHDWKTKFSYKFELNIKGRSDEEVLMSIEEIGIPKDSWFVCLHVRESGFRKDKGRREYRNSNINNYIPAIQEIQSRGGWVVRMGDNTMVPLPIMKNVIDYPFSKFKSDYMDLYLIKHCRFYIGCQSGIFDVAKLFHKQTLLVNMYNWTFGGPLHSNDRGIMKHLFHKKSGKYLSVSELFSGGWETQNMNGIVDDFVYVENSQEEILDAVTNYLTCIGNNSFPVTELQIQSIDHIKKQAYSIFKNSRLSPVDVMSDEEEIVEKYRIASQVEGSTGFICNSYLEKNWKHDSLNN